MKRTAEIARKTNETDIYAKLCIDGGNVNIDTGIGFFNHMLELFAKHGGFGLELHAKGDLDVDSHHTVEDTGIVLGKAFYNAAADKQGINRYSNILLPMDEALVELALDFGGRPYLNFDLKFNSDKVGNFDLQLVEEFLRAFVFNAKINAHIILRCGRNDHHIAEAVFKALARCLKAALTIVSSDIPSTKGVIE